MTETPTETLVTVFGGSGFLGRHVTRALVREGYRVRPAVRRPDLAGHLQPLGRVGQIHSVQANLRYPASVERAMEGADVAINLVGILYERGKQRFEAVQAEGAHAVAQAAGAAGARVIHVSALGADADSPSLYARSKAAGEAAVLAAARDAVIFRPSIVFGPEDDFFNRFGAMARMFPMLLLTPDQVELLRSDNIVSGVAMSEGRTLQALGIEPAAMEAIVPSYLWRFRKTGQFRAQGA